MNEQGHRVGGMVLTRRRWSTRSRSFSSAPAPNTNLICTGLESNSGFLSERTTTNRLSEGTALGSSAVTFGGT